MTSRYRSTALTMLGGFTGALVACSGSGAHPTRAGGGGGALSGGGADGFALRPFLAPPLAPAAGSVLFTASGEALAFSGYRFPPAADGDPAFVDGWEVSFDHLLVTVDQIRLSANPDKVPTDQAQTGALLAEADGPWAVDLHPPGALSGKGGGDETAVPIALLSNQNRNGNSAFDTANGTRYAFGFDLIAATPAAQNVNLDGSALAAYQAMAQQGCAVLYLGTATFKGGACTPTDPEFARLPRSTVRFNLCFKSPTTYVNCQNPDNSGAPFAGEEAVRGIALPDNTFAIAQVTIHTDHPFWDSTVHDSPAHFDQLAAQVSDAGDAGDAGDVVTPTVTMADLVGVDYLAFDDRHGHPLPWRSCLGPAAYTPSAGQMHFDAQSIAKIAASGDPATGFRDYADFATYNQSTQGHLNSDGLCAVKHNFPAPN
jgi:hypothetical protein